MIAMREECNVCLRCRSRGLTAHACPAGPELLTAHPPLGWKELAVWEVDIEIPPRYSFALLYKYVIPRNAAFLFGTRQTSRSFRCRHFVCA